MLYYVAAGVVQGGIKSLVSFSWWATGKVVETSVDMGSALVLHALIPWTVKPVYGLIVGEEEKEKTSKQEIVNKIELLKRELDEIEDDVVNGLPEDNTDNPGTDRKSEDEKLDDDTLPCENENTKVEDLGSGWALLSKKKK